jgi:hypothetical protein
VGPVLAIVGPPDLALLPVEQMIAIFFYAMVLFLVANDAIKAIIINRLVPAAVV